VRTNYAGIEIRDTYENDYLKPFMELVDPLQPGPGGFLALHFAIGFGQLHALSRISATPYHLEDLEKARQLTKRLDNFTQTTLAYTFRGNDDYWRRRMNATFGESVSELIVVDMQYSKVLYTRRVSDHKIKQHGAVLVAKFITKLLDNCIRIPGDVELWKLPPFEYPTRDLHDLWNRPKDYDEACIQILQECLHRLNERYPSAPSPVATVKPKLRRINATHQTIAFCIPILLFCSLIFLYSMYFVHSVLTWF
jgi:hypothetical protein